MPGLQIVGFGEDLDLCTWLGMNLRVNCCNHATEPFKDDVVAAGHDKAPSSQNI